MYTSEISTARMKEILMNSALRGKFSDETYLPIPGQLLSPTGKWLTQVFYRKNIDVIGVYWVGKDGEEECIALSALNKDTQEEIIRRVFMPIVSNNTTW